MDQAVPRQHPAVVLRSHFRLVSALLAVAMIAVVGLTLAVVLVSNDDAPAINATSPADVRSSAGIRYDGGPDEGTSGVRATQPAPVARYDGGPEEGTSGLTFSEASSNTAPGIRYDGGPEEGSWNPAR
jgi:hypothetical protein